MFKNKINSSNISAHIVVKSICFVLIFLGNNNNNNKNNTKIRVRPTEYGKTDKNWKCQ